MSYPTINRIINFYPMDRPADQTYPVPALVCGVDPSKTDGVHLHLTVFDPLRGPYLVRGVQGNNEGQGQGQWCWPTVAGAGISGGVRSAPFEERFGGRPSNFRDHAEEIAARIRDARERGKAEGKTLDEQVRRDIANDPVGYGDERTLGEIPLMEERSPSEGAPSRDATGD